MMNTKTKLENQSLIQFKNRAGAGAVALLLLLPLAAWSGGVVTNCTESNLRAAMVGGGTVTFACDGTITLTSTITNDVSTMLDGSGHQVTISGGNAVRVFHVNSNVTFTLVNLSVANGASTNGAGIFNAGGTLSLVSSVFLTNVASVARDGEGFVNGEGGAIYNFGGTVVGVNCFFVGNRAQQMTNTRDWFGASPAGGAVVNASGQVSFSNCVFRGNSALGAAGFYYPNSQPGPPAYSTPGRGGAIFNRGTLTVSACTFLRNAVRGGDGGQPGPPCNFPCTTPGSTGGSGNDGEGGAIYSYGVMEITASTFLENTATGGTGGKGGPGPQASTAIEGGMGGAGGAGRGGTLFVGGRATLIDCTVANNVCLGGTGGMGGTGGEAMSSGLPGGRGGRGGAGGNGSGNLHHASGLLSLTSCTFAQNQGVPGAGGAGGLGGIGRGGIGSNGNPGPGGTALGGLSANGTTLMNTILAGNAPGGNTSGIIQDAGHSLSSDASCAFTNVGSLNNTDPKLGPLADNGGPTLTMALLASSPAIDAGDSASAPAADQRGFPRAGLAADIGAFEYGSMLPFLSITRSGSNGVEILVWGNAGNSCRLLTSTELLHWQCVATNQIGADGTVLFQDNCAAGETQRFYRVAVP